MEYILISYKFIMVNVIWHIHTKLVLLKQFTTAITLGTIDYNTYKDNLGLYWKSRTITDANNLLYHITSYTDFLSDQNSQSKTLINPFKKANSWEERLNWCAYYHKQANVFLNHLSSKSNEYLYVRSIKGFQAPLINQDIVKKFPEEIIEDIIDYGFVVKGRQDYQAQAITYLLHYGGLRKSEVFHIFVSDITLHPNYKNEALVRVYHPQYGSSPDSRYRNREEYLKTETVYKPRNSYNLSERLYSGWKGALLASKKGYYEVVFNPPVAAKAFLEIWVNYLKYQRVEPKIFHPFAFTNSLGFPETLKNYQRKHKNAVERMGIEHKKDLGTTEHGHRHAYGYRSRQAGLNRLEIQKSMHHRSPLSSLIYTQSTIEEIRGKLKEIK